MLYLLTVDLELLCSFKLSRYSKTVVLKQTILEIEPAIIEDERITQLLLGQTFFQTDKLQK